MVARHVPLLLLLAKPAVRSIPAGPLHTCGSVELVHTNMVEAEAAVVIEAYMSFAESAQKARDIESADIAKTIMRQFGGFWDVMMIGDAFSYSVYCLVRT